MKLKMFTILALAGSVVLSGCSANKIRKRSTRTDTGSSKTEDAGSGNRGAG